MIKSDFKTLLGGCSSVLLESEAEADVRFIANNNHNENNIEW